MEDTVRDIIEKIIENTYWMNEDSVGEYEKVSREILDQHELRLTLQAYEKALEESGFKIEIKVTKKD